MARKGGRNKRGKQTKQIKQDKLWIGLVQMRAEENPEANLARAIAKVRAAARRGAQVVCLQELFRSRYFPQSEDSAKFNLAEPIPGPTTEVLSRAARDLEIVVIASIFERRAPGVYHNTAVVIDADGALVGKYRKMHIPDDPGYYEKFYFTPGDLGFPSFKTRYATVGVLICWDQWFPEAARLAALSGAEVIFYPTAIGSFTDDSRATARTQRQAWELVQRGHAVANGIYVAAVNRVGREGSVRFWGSSFVAGPFGELLAQASEAREEIVVAGLEREKIDATRRNWPFLRDRRIDAYGPLATRLLDGGPEAKKLP